jgi:C4-type Zn-finger protein
MAKRKFIAEDDDRDGYADAECPECGAIINARFQRGRNWRRIQCPVCQSHVKVSIQLEETPLIQIQRVDAE